MSTNWNQIRSRLFDWDNPMMRVLTRIFDLILLNVLFAVCCIPVVTIGPSLSAMYTITLKMARNEESHIIREFFKAFRENFRQAVLFGVAATAFFIFLVVDLFLLRGAGKNMNIIKIICYAAGILGYLICLYAFPLTARFVYTSKEVFHNAVLMSMIHLPQTALMVLLNIPFIYLALYSGVSFMMVLWFMLIFGFALMAYIQSLIFRKIFDKYERKVYE